MKQIIDITGNRYGKLTVLGFHHTDAYGKSHWICQCDCGNVKILRKDNFATKSGQTISCGCVRNENIRKAGIAYREKMKK